MAITDLDTLHRAVETVASGRFCPRRGGQTLAICHLIAGQIALGDIPAIFLYTPHPAHARKTLRTVLDEHGMWNEGRGWDRIVARGEARKTISVIVLRPEPITTAPTRENFGYLWRTYRDTRPWDERKGYWTATEVELRRIEFSGEDVEWRDASRRVLARLEGWRPPNGPSPYADEYPPEAP